MSSLQALSSPDFSVRMDALSGIDESDLVLAAAVIVENARTRNVLMRRDETARELANVVITGNSLHLTRIVINLARQYDLVGHLAVQYTELLNGRGSFSESLKSCRDEHFLVLATEYAHEEAMVSRRWLRGQWAEQPMVDLVPFVTDENVLLYLVRCQRLSIADAALARCVELMEPEQLDRVLTSCTVRDLAWADAVAHATLETRKELAIKPDLSFIKRRNAQKTLSTETLQELWSIAEPHVRTGIEESLASRDV